MRTAILCDIVALPKGHVVATRIAKEGDDFAQEALCRRRDGNSDPLGPPGPSMLLALLEGLRSSLWARPTARASPG